MALVAPYVERRWKSPDGLDLFARDYAPGAGFARAPVVAIHGLTRNSADFDVIASLLAQSGRRVLAVDVRGRGLSDRAPDPMTYTPEVYARDVLDHRLCSLWCKLHPHRPLLCRSYLFRICFGGFRLLSVVVVAVVVCCVWWWWLSLDVVVPVAGEAIFPHY